MVNKILNISLVIEEYKEIRPLCIFLPETSIYKRYSDKNKCMYFIIKDIYIYDNFGKSYVNKINKK